MGKLSRLIGLASDALDKSSGSGRSGSSSHSERSTDWGGMLRGAVDAVRGPSDATPGPSGGARAGASDPYAPPPAPGAGRMQSQATDADRAAIARYDYLLQTADPRQVEQIHREAFSRLTPPQRALVEGRMQRELAPGERPRSSSADDLARAAGRAEAMNPGRMRGLLSRVRGAGPGGAAVVAGGAAVGILGVVAGGAVLSSVAGPLLDQAANLGVDFGALAEGIDLESLVSGADVDALTGGAEELLGTAGEAAAGVGDAATGWGERLGDLGIPGIGDLFGR